MKAATWLLSNSFWQSGEYRPYAISFPVIVTSSPLFECALDAGGVPTLKAISHGSLFFKKQIAGSDPTCIAIVNEQHLETFVDECNEVAEKLLAALEPSLEQDWIAFLGKNGQKIPDN